MRFHFDLYPDAFYLGLMTESRVGAGVDPEELTFPDRADIAPLSDLVLINARQNMVYVALDLTISGQPPTDLRHWGTSALGGVLGFDCGPAGCESTDVVIEHGAYDVYGEIEHIDNPYADDVPDQRCSVWLVRVPDSV